MWQTESNFKDFSRNILVSNYIELECSYNKAMHFFESTKFSFCLEDFIIKLFNYSQTVATLVDGFNQGGIFDSKVNNQLIEHEHMNLIICLANKMKHEKLDIDIRTPNELTYIPETQRLQKGLYVTKGNFKLHDRNARRPFFIEKKISKNKSKITNFASSSHKANVYIEQLCKSEEGLNENLKDDLLEERIEIFRECIVNLHTSLLLFIEKQLR